MDFKEEIEIEDFGMLHANLYVLIGFVSSFGYQNGLPVKMTSLISDQVKGRVSRSHITGRAADFSIRDWPEEKINELVAKGNGLFYDVAALSSSDNKPRAFVLHDADNNTGLHLHVQCRP